MNFETTPEQEKGIQKAEEERKEICDRILAKDFYKIVESMRAAQVRYFKTRKQSDLQDAKDLEYKVDKFLKDKDSKQTTIF